MENSHMKGINFTLNSLEDELIASEMDSENKSMNNVRRHNINLSKRIKINDVNNNQNSNEFFKIITDSNKNREDNERDITRVFYKDEQIINNITYYQENQNEVIENGNVLNMYNSSHGNISNIANVYDGFEESESVSFIDIENSLDNFSIGYADYIFDSEFTESNNTIEVFTDSQEHTDNNIDIEDNINLNNTNEHDISLNNINEDNINLNNTDEHNINRNDTYRHNNNQNNIHAEQNNRNEQNRTSQNSFLDEFESNDVIILNNGETTDELEDAVQILENTVYISSDILSDSEFNNYFNNADTYYLSGNSNSVRIVNDEHLEYRRVALDRYIRQLNNNIRRRTGARNVAETNDFMELIETSYDPFCRKYISRIEQNLQNFKLELKDRCTYVGNIRREMIDTLYFTKYKNILDELSRVRVGKMDNILKEVADLGAYLREDEIDYLIFILTRDFKMNSNKNYGIIKLLKKVYSLIYGKLSKLFLPKKLYKSVRYDELINATETACLICLVNYNKRSKCVVTDCLHIFHANCMKTWLKTSYNCPKCREKPNS